jgi:hypothetical protein
MRTDTDDIRGTDVTYKRRRAWVAPVLVLLAIAGLGWWVVSATRDDLAMAPANDVYVPPAVTPAPIVPAPIVPAPAVPGGAGGLGENLGVAPAPLTPPAAAPDALAQMTQTTNGRVDEFDPLRRTLTLENGDTFLLAANVPGADTLTPGANVTLTYRLDGDQKIIQTITRSAATPLPENAPLVPAIPAAPIAPGAAPLPMAP